MVTRAEHLAWCKKRACEYFDANDVRQGLMSFVSDMSKHPETEKHSALQLMAMMLMGGQLRDVESAREFVLGFN